MIINQAAVQAVIDRSRGKVGSAGLPPHPSSEVLYRGERDASTPGYPVVVVDGGAGHAAVRLNLSRGFPVAARVDPNFSHCCLRCAQRSWETFQWSLPPGLDCDNLTCSNLPDACGRGPEIWIREFAFR